MAETDLHRKLVEFWDQPTCFDAKYRRIVTDAKICAIEDEAALERLWQASIEEHLGYVLYGVQLDPDWSILEIGAGVGRLLLPLSKKVAQARGVDISPAMVEFSQAYLRDYPNAKVILNDGRSLPMFRGNEFDFCYSMICFQHIPDVDMVRDYLREIARVLKPGGTLRIQVVQEPHTLRKLAAAIRLRRLSCLRRNRVGKWCGEEEIGFEGNRYTKGQLRRLLKSVGFQTVNWQEGLGSRRWLWVTSVKRQQGVSDSPAGIPRQIQRKAQGR